MAMGLTLNESASIAMVGGADGPMVLYTSMCLSKHLFVPITVVAYLYLGLTYGGYPYLIRLLVPKKLRAIKMEREAPAKPVSQNINLGPGRTFVCNFMLPVPGCIAIILLIVCRYCNSRIRAYPYSEFY